MIAYVYAILLPPGINLLLFIIGLCLLRYWYNFGLTILLLGLISLYGFSIPIVASRLIAPLQQTSALNLASLPGQEKAIVVLTGGGRYAPEYQHSQPSGHSLVREVYAAHLHKVTGLPIIIVGGKGYFGTIPESEVMQKNLMRNFNIPTQHIETTSRNTWENALNIQVYLKEKQVDQFYLVSSAFHMPRAMLAFTRFNMKPTPAPTDYLPADDAMTKLNNWLPNAKMLYLSAVALHEYMGKAYYQHKDA